MPFLSGQMKRSATCCQYSLSRDYTKSVELGTEAVNNRNHREEENRHQNETMPYGLRIVIAALLCALCSALAFGQDQAEDSAKVSRHEAKHNRKHERTLNSDERLAVLAAALDSKIPRFAESDCSHLVHAIYERAGFPYEYADSDDLYDGVGGFERVSKPEPGDLVVWRGHAGVVVRPSRHVFYSFLHAGPGIDDYESRYWKGRGRARFYRYVKNSGCAGCTLARKTE